MVFENYISKLRSFLRQEYFDPDVMRALLVTSGLVVPLLFAHAFDIPAYGSFAAITSQLLLGAKIQTTYSRKAFILATSLIFISLAPLIGYFVDSMKADDQSQLLIQMRDGTSLTASREASKVLREMAI